MALAIVLFFYAANSEVAWLFLLAYWVVAIVIASFLYALWNRGFTAQPALVDRARAEGFELDAPAEQSVGSEPFEGDRGKLRLTLRAERHSIGPAKVSLAIGDEDLSVAAGLVTKAGHVVEQPIPALRRGPLDLSDWRFETSDPLGLFRRRVDGADQEIAVVLPRFASLRAHPPVRELEAAVTAPRAGTGTEVFGVREYRPGDPLRRIHWRTTARRGELIVREFEPPGVQNLGIFLEAEPPTDEAADQMARLAASETWDCLRSGGRVTLWAPGCEPSHPADQRSLLALLEWLARYPEPADDDLPAPIVADAIGVTSTNDARLLESIEDVRAHGGSVRAWVLGDATIESDIEVERTGLAWPL